MADVLAEEDDEFTDALAKVICAGRRIGLPEAELEAAMSFMSDHPTRWLNRSTKPSSHRPSEGK